jgi:hypothetical protein
MRQLYNIFVYREYIFSEFWFWSLLIRNMSEIKTKVGASEERKRGVIRKVNIVWRNKYKRKKKRVFCFYCFIYVYSSWNTNLLIKKRRKISSSICIFIYMTTRNVLVVVYRSRIYIVKRAVQKQTKTRFLHIILFHYIVFIWNN